MNDSSRRIDKSSPVPVFFQIAEAIRWQISTGQLEPGYQLPPTREAATLWGVNRHTIRRSYQELVSQGLVESRGTSRMVVAKNQQPTAAEEKLSPFVAKVCREARSSFGLSPIELARLIQRVSDDRKPVINVVECNHYQCFDLKRQLEQRFDVIAKEFLLTTDGEPEPGPIVGTLFHANEICARWPGRRNEVRFGGLYVNPQVADRILRCCRSGKRIRDIVVTSERHETDAFNLASDLSMAISDKSVSVSAGKPGQSVAELLKRGKVVAVAPWNWDSLDTRIQNHARCFLLQYCFDPIDLESVGERFGLADRSRQLA